MEALVILIAELIFAPAVALAGAMTELFATGFAALLEFLFGFVQFRLRKRQQAEQAPVSPRVPPAAPGKVFRYLRNTLLLLAAVIILTLLLMNYMMLDSVAKWAVARIEQRSGIAISYTTFSGDLFKADFKFTGLHARRTDDPYFNFDISAQLLEIDMATLWNPFAEVKLNQVRVAGVTGDLQRVQKRDVYHERKAFIVNSLALENVRINYRDVSAAQQSSELNIFIHDWNSRPMRSRYALFDMFFRSNAHGTVNDNDFTIETSTVDGGRHTRWLVRAVPVQLLRTLVGGPFKLMESGSVDVKIDDQWRLAENPDIEFTWNFTFNRLKAAVPADYAGLRRKLAEHIVAYLNTRPPQFDVSFGMTMNAREFSGKSSLAAAGLWRSMVNALANHLSRASGYSEDEIKSKVKQGIDVLKGYLDKRRKGEQ